LKYFSEYFLGCVGLVESLAEVLRPGAEGGVDVAPLWKALRPLKNLRPLLLVMKAISTSPEKESTISPSMETFPTLNRGTSSPTPGAIAWVATAVVPVTAGFRIEFRGGLYQGLWGATGFWWRTTTVESLVEKIRRLRLIGSIGILRCAQDDGKNARLRPLRSTGRQERVTATTALRMRTTNSKDNSRFLRCVAE
jgi:hypothetical protein